MNRVQRRGRILVIIGLATSIIGAIDPLEGSIVMLAGLGIAAAGAYFAASRHLKWLLLSFAVMAVGVAAMWGLSALGGFGGNSGRSYWWGLILLPFPVGWIMGIVGAIRSLRNLRASPDPPVRDGSM